MKDLRPMNSNDLWETHAEWWIREFTDGADPEYEEQILPMVLREVEGATRVLDLGCGEGQISRGLVAAGVPTVIGIDPTFNQIEVARQRGGVFARAGSVSLPFRDSSFDTVVACLVFEHVRNLDSSLSEIARVLEPGGRFCFFLNHPLLQTPDSGWIDDQFVDPPEQYWRIGAYLREEERLEDVEKGVFIPFIHRPLSRYLNALAANGLYLEFMDEPSPPPGFLLRAPEYVEAATVPRLLYLRLVRR
jgi:SAM-dependent methyltransferase